MSIITEVEANNAKCRARALSSYIRANRSLFSHAWLGKGAFSAPAIWCNCRPWRCITLPSPARGWDKVTLWACQSAQSGLRATSNSAARNVGSCRSSNQLEDAAPSNPHEGRFCWDLLPTSILKHLLNYTRQQLLLAGPFLYLRCSLASRNPLCNCCPHLLLLGSAIRCARACDM